MNTQWHADPKILDSYASGRLDVASAYSLEAHLLACGRCRASLSPLMQPAVVARIWSEIEEAVDAPRPGSVERLLRRFGLPDHLSRLLAATPSLRLSWLAGVGVALSFALLAARGDHAGVVVFLAMAPLIPVAGVAAAFGPGIDPTYEVGVAAPLRSFRLLLIRSTAVLAASIVLVGGAAFALPRLDWTAAAWLLPAIALTLATLAASTVAEPLPSAAGVAFGWIFAVTLVGHLAGNGVAAFHTTGQVLCLGLAAVAGLVLTRRSEAFDRRSS
jgi:hypothetical protein